MLFLVSCPRSSRRVGTGAFAPRRRPWKTRAGAFFIFCMEIINMAWVTLGIAGIFEVVWATCMKCSEGFIKLSWSLLVCRHGGELFPAGTHNQNTPARCGLCGPDRERRAGLRDRWHHLVQRAGDSGCIVTMCNFFTETRGVYSSLIYFS